jgi:hypothetical protein
MVSFSAYDGIRYAMFGAVLAAAAALSWFLGHNETWETIEGTLLVFGGLFLIANAWLAFRHRDRAYIAYAASTVALYLAWLVPGTLYPDERVMIDNHGDRSVRLALDGEEWLTLGARSGTERSLRGGTYLLTVQARDDGKELDRRTITVAARGYDEKDKVYVLNLLGLGKYSWGEVTYGGSPANLRPGRDTAEPWFSVEAFYVFEKPPVALTLKRGKQVTLGYLRRVSGDLAASP